MMVFYGSETGTAEEFSKNFALEAPRHGFQAHVVDLEHFVPEMLSGDLDGLDDETRDRVKPMIADSGPIGVFLMATCGEGDPTNNARGFMSWLSGEDGTEASSPALRYAVFGLGNRGYEHFNAAGKATDSGLQAAGAERVAETGLGDDDGDMESDFGDWQSGVWASLRKAAAADLGLEAGDTGEEERAPEGAAALPPKSLAPWRVVEVPAPADVLAPDTARDDLDDAKAASDAAAAVGGAGPAQVPGAGWRGSEPLRCLSRRQLLAMGGGADPVRVRWFQAVPVRMAARCEARQRAGVGASTAHVELDVGAASLPYGCADDAAVLPENPAGDVDRLCRMMDVDGDQWFTLEGDAIAPALLRAEAAAAAGGPPADPVHASVRAGEKPPPFPVPCTVGRALQRYVDLGGPPSKALAGQLAHWAGSTEDRDALARLVAPSGRAEWDDFVRKPRRSVLELLSAFPSVRPPLGQLLHLLPPLKPREYTIASSPLAHPASMHLAVSVLDEPKPAAKTDGPGRRLVGACSGYLAGGTSGAGPADASSPVRVAVRPSTFKLPADPSTPVVMVGPGTGLAPMRAFCQEREALRRGGAALGEALLFFGCRRSDEDFIYRGELEAWRASGVLTELHTAFSREAAGGDKVYVQHRLAEQGARVWDLVSNHGAHVFVCGATAMGSDVVRALARVATDHGGLGDAAASAFVSRLEKEHRLVQELWS